MRNLLLTAGLMAAGIGAASAQGSMNIKTNFLAPISVYYEYGFSDNLSVQGGVGYSLLANAFSNAIELEGYSANWASYSVPIEARFYPFADDEPLSGIHIGPYVKYTNWTIKETQTVDPIFGGLGYESKYTSNQFAVGVTAGYQRYFAEKFVYNVFVGYGINVADSFTEKTTFSDGTVDTDGFGDPVVFPISVRSGLCIGYRFGE